MGECINMKPDQTEEDTKARFITPALQKAGWSTGQMLMEYYLTRDRHRIMPGKLKTAREDKKRKKPDYLLCYRQNCPIAVIEAKKYAKEDTEGIDQAISYARLLDLPYAYASAGKGFVEYNLKTGVQREIPLDAFPGPEALWEKYCQAKNITNTAATTLNKAQYYTSANGKIPRYYQLVAVNRTIEAIIANNRKRLLLVMATGTGKTYTAFQIVWRLHKAGIVKNVLYLADRNQLIDQTQSNDFKPFGKIQTKIRDGEINDNYQIFFGLYQQLAGSEEVDEDETHILTQFNYAQVRPDFFDLVIVDECHRGSAKENSNWRKILDYFKPAIQIGMTATPNRKDKADNLDYFGEPVYTYSLKQGINDGFLAPYQVISIKLDKDISGWMPKENEKDDKGNLIPRRLYKLSDFDREIELTQRIKLVAATVSEYVQHLGGMAKTIVFCTTQRHALKMRDALREHNPGKMAENPHYIVRMTADDEEGKAQYDAFTSIYQDYPVIATTSKLLTTGADTRCVKLIVLDTPVKSMTEFKQIIGRGTRLVEEAGKTFFTILDFRGVCQLFNDPEFDGEPDASETVGIDPEGKNRHITGEELITKQPEPSLPAPELEQSVSIYVVGGVEVKRIGETVSYLDENGKLVTAKFRDYTRRQILRRFGHEKDFLEVWNGKQEKQAIINDLAKNGILIEHLKEEIGNPDIDEFDLICHFAFGSPVLTRNMRASKLRQTRFLEKYQGAAREILEKLLDIYARIGVTEIENIAVLKSGDFTSFGSRKNILNNFGGEKGYLQAVKAMQAALYTPSSTPAETRPS